MSDMGSARRLWDAVFADVLGDTGRLDTVTAGAEGVTARVLYTDSDGGLKMVYGWTRAATPPNMYALAWYMRRNITGEKEPMHGPTLDQLRDWRERAEIGEAMTDETNKQTAPIVGDLDPLRLLRGELAVSFQMVEFLRQRFLDGTLPLRMDDNGEGSIMAYQREREHLARVCELLILAGGSP